MSAGFKDALLTGLCHTCVKVVTRTETLKHVCRYPGTKLKTQTREHTELRERSSQVRELEEVYGVIRLGPGRSGQRLLCGFPLFPTS